MSSLEKPRSDEAIQMTELTKKRDFALAKKITFWHMAHALLDDINQGVTLSSEFKPLSRKGDNRVRIFYFIE